MPDLASVEAGIRQLHARCADAVWRQDTAAFAGCFTEDGEWKVAARHLRGRAEIAAVFGGLASRFQRVLMSFGTPILEISDIVVSGRTYVIEHNKPIAGPAVLNIGIYYERFVEEAGGWRFRWRHWSHQYRGPADLSANLLASPDYGPPPGMPRDDDPTLPPGA